MKTETEMIGGWATVRYIDEKEPLSRDVYFSFGQYDEATESDTFGVWDETIFFYATGESELKEMMEQFFDFSDSIPSLFLAVK